RMQIEVSFADYFRGGRKAEPLNHGGAAAEEARVDILEVDSIGNVFQQCAQQIAFISQSFLGQLSLGNVPKNSLDADDPSQGVVEWCFDDMDEEPLTRGSLMFLRNVEGFEALHN